MADILIFKCRVPLAHEIMKNLSDYLKSQKETGVIILPPYLEAQVVPDDIKIKLIDENGKEI